MMRIVRHEASVGASLFSVTKCFLAGALLSSSLVAGAQTWVSGDVIAGVGNGQYNIYSNSGTYKQTITDSFANGYSTGCAFSADFKKLYGTNFSNDAASIFDGTGTVHALLKTIDTSAAGSSAESVELDKAGNYYIGHADGAHGISKFSSADALVTNFFPATESRGTDWVEVAADQKTIFYSSEGAHLKRYDISTSTQLADYSVALPNVAYAHKLLPPFDGSTGALVADTNTIVRLDKNGNVVQTYTASGASVWFSLNIDPNGTSFWAGDLGTNNLYRFNIASGAVEVGPIATTATNGSQLAGVCVKGELTIVTDTTPPVIVVSNILPGPPKQVVLSTHDTQSGLKTLQVLNCTNCTAVNGKFTAGTNANVLTTATKTDQSKSSTIKLEATDVAGNVTIFDPVDFSLRDGGKQRSDTVNIIPAEHIVLIANGTPGVRQLEIEVNEHTVPIIVNLTNGEGTKIDIGRFIKPNIQNKVTVTAYGPPGATAWVVITQQ